MEKLLPSSNLVPGFASYRLDCCRTFRELLRGHEDTAASQRAGLLSISLVWREFGDIEEKRRFSSSTTSFHSHRQAVDRGSVRDMRQSEPPHLRSGRNGDQNAECPRRCVKCDETLYEPCGPKQPRARCLCGFYIRGWREGKLCPPCEATKPHKPRALRPKIMSCVASDARAEERGALLIPLFCCASCFARLLCGCICKDSSGTSSKCSAGNRPF